MSFWIAPTLNERSRQPAVRQQEDKNNNTDVVKVCPAYYPGASTKTLFG